MTDQSSSDSLLWQRPARRHNRRTLTRRSRLVSLAKYILLGLALLLIALVLAWPDLIGDQERLGFSVKGFGKDDMELRMVNARYMGKDRRNRPFMITAEAANQDADDHWQINMTTLQADLGIENGDWYLAMADRGNYHQKKQTLDLTGDIRIFSNLGYELNTESSLIDLANGDAQSDRPVRARWPAGYIEAEQMRIFDFGEVIRFKGAVKVTLLPNVEG